MPRGEGAFDWEGAEDLTSLSDEGLRARLAALAEEERGLGYGLRIVQGRMDVPEELARALLGEVRVPGRRS